MIVLRAFDPSRRGERGFICSTWFLSYDHKRAGVDRATYMREQGPLVDRILASPRTRIIVACSDGNESTLHAWAAGERGGPLHYVYVPPELRREGLASRVITDVLGEYPSRGECTHRPPAFLEERFRFNPYSLSRLEAA